VSYKFLCIFLVVTSCGEENFTGGNRVLTPPQEEEQIAPAPKDFKTRISNILLIEGHICQGIETTETGGHGFKCLAGQYLVFIDNVNTCDSNGLCTNFEVIPIIGELEDIGARTSGVSIFTINARSPVTEDQATILRSINVSSDLNGNGTVFSND
jgi:hypothetical protein